MLNIWIVGNVKVITKIVISLDHNIYLGNHSNFIHWSYTSPHLVRITSLPGGVYNYGNLQKKDIDWENNRNS